MTEKNEDSKKTLEEIIRQLIAAAQEGKIRPVFVGMNVVITPGGDSPSPPQRARGDGTEPEIEVQSVGDRVLLVTEMPGLPRRTSRYSSEATGSLSGESTGIGSIGAAQRFPHQVRVRRRSRIATAYWRSRMCRWQNTTLERRRPNLE